MDLMTPVVILAMLAVVGTLIFGISSMATGGTVAHQSSVQWMTWRVGLQALAFALILLAIFGLG